jgi:hypothetical protein
LRAVIRAIKRGWCRTHYLRWYKYGDPLELKRIREIPTEALKELLDKAVSAKGYECVIWPFQTHKFRDMGPGQSVTRFVCAIVNGPRPTPKHEVAHSCGKGHLRCISGNHLRWATHTENMADKIIHGTTNRGPGYVAPLQFNGLNLFA